MSDDDSSDVSFEELEQAIAAQSLPPASRRTTFSKPVPLTAKSTTRQRTRSDASDHDDYGKQQQLQQQPQSQVTVWSDVDHSNLDSSAIQLVQTIVATAPTDESIRDIAWQPLPQFLVAQEPVDPLGMGRLDFDHMRLVRGSPTPPFSIISGLCSYALAHCCPTLQQPTSAAVWANLLERVTLAASVMLTWCCSPAGGPRCRLQQWARWLHRRACGEATAACLSCRAVQRCAGVVYAVVVGSATT